MIRKQTEDGSQTIGATFLQGAERQTAEGPTLTAIVWVARAHARPCTPGGGVEDAKFSYPQPLETQDLVEVATWSATIPVGLWSMAVMAVSGAKRCWYTFMTHPQEDILESTSDYGSGVSGMGCRGMCKCMSPLVQSVTRTRGYGQTLGHLCSVTKLGILETGSIWTSWVHFWRVIGATSTC